MRYGIFGDILGNYDALHAVLSALELCDVEVLLCTGDVVGWGAEGSKCIRTVRERCTACVAGNYDHVACGKLNTDNFNKYAAQVAAQSRAKPHSRPLILPRTR